MKVKELIRTTVWMPGRGYDASKKPKVSVLLPTFRRGKSGLFRRCVKSILAQTLEDIELIIIDDGSTDGTAEQIEDFQDLDGRVSCLRHTKNIGLPAVSEYEGFLKARADMLSFAFDDVMFNEDALEKLLEQSEEAPHAVVWGHIEWSHFDPGTGQIVRSRLGMERSQGALRVFNFIPNCAVLMPRRIVEDVGFYDPHVGMARICDWDLWCRVSERYELKFVDVAVGLEDGPISGDSVGSTYTLDSAAADEWMRLERNEKLRPQNLGEYDVFALDPRLGQSTLTVLDRLARKHAAPRKMRPPGASVTTEDPDGYILVVGLDYNASIALCFDMLPPTIARRVRLVSYAGGLGYEEMVRATCVIFVRSVGVLSLWIDAARSMGIPMYFYLDDNLTLLQVNKEVSVDGEDYSVMRFAEDLKMFDGALLTSPNLVSYFRDHLLHDNVYYCPVAVYDQKPLVPDYRIKKRPGEIVIVCAGGNHRSKGLRDVVFPAIRKIADSGKLIHFVVVAGALGDLSGRNLPDELRITEIPYDIGYLFALRRLGRYSPDILVHPPSDTTNNAYKTLNALVTAKLLDSVLVAPFIEPYIQLRDEGVAVLVEKSDRPSSWFDALSRILNEQIDNALIKSRSSDYCQKHFSGEKNARMLRDILRKHGGEVPWSEQGARLHSLFGWTRAKTGLSVQQASPGRVEENVRLISDYRKMTRYSLRHRLLRRPSDLWDAIDFRFARLKKYSEKSGWRRRGSSLELSDSLSEIPFREYIVSPPSGKLKAVLIAVSVDLVQHGVVGVEVVGPDHQIKDNVVVDLHRATLNEPVRFDLSNVNVNSDDESWKIRVFARSNIAVYVFEFINRRSFGLRFARPTPFMEFVTA